MTAQADLIREITEQVMELPFGDQLRVRDFVRALAMTEPKGMSGREFAALVASLGFDKQDLREMSAAIEEDYERVDTDGR
jgi:hypothetical protein